MKAPKNRGLFVVPAMSSDNLKKHEKNIDDSTALSLYHSLDTFVKTVHRTFTIKHTPFPLYHRRHMVLVIFTKWP